MVHSAAATVEEYLEELPGERQEAVTTVRQAILDNLPDGYRETMQHGMISYVIPLETYPKTYNGQPLVFASLASQKNYMSVYLMGVYADAETEEWFLDRYKATGKKLNMGKCCVRFKKLDDLPIELVGEAVARTPMQKYIECYEASRRKG